MSQIDCNDCPYRFMCHDLGLLMECTTSWSHRRFIRGFEWRCPMERPDFYKMADEYELIEELKDEADRRMSDWKGRYA